MTHSPIKPPNLSLVLICVLAAVCIAIPAYVFLWKVYPWHLKQPETVQGGIELLIVFILLAVAILLTQRARICSIIVSVLTILYLQLHSILLPAAAALLYFEFLIQVGGAIQRLIGAGNRDGRNLRAYLGRFLVGAAFWLLGALLLSAFGIGTISSLRFYTIALAVISLAIERGIAPLSLMLVRHFEELSSRDRILVAFLLILILTQFGKANYGMDYDSTWYGFRPERVLVGPHSLFDNLKLVHCVYYYPKQFETLSLPLAALNRGVFIIAFNVILMGLGFLAIFEIGRELDLSRTGALLVTAIAAGIPAFSNMASTAKTDNLLSVYAFIAALFMWRWCRERRGLDLAYGIAALIGMAGTKITTYVYAPLLMAGFLLVGVWLRSSDKHQLRQSGEASSQIILNEASKKAPVIIVSIAVCAYCGLILRTWMLTDVPTIPILVDVWKLIGLHPKYPWNSFVFSLGFPIRAQEFLVYWYKLLFDPRGYSHYLMVWPGNAAAFSICALLILLVTGAIRRGRQFAFLCACLPLMIGGLITVCVVRKLGEGGTDGNYYAIPVLLTILSVAGVLSSASGRIRTTMIACTFGFIVLHLPIMFVSHWSWHPGTQAFSLALNKTLFDTEAEAKARLKGAGAWEIEEYLRKNSRAGLCVGFSNGEESALHLLSCIHEDFEQTSVQFPPLFATQPEFRKYLAWARPDLFIMPKSTAYRPAGPTGAVRAVFQELSQNPDVIKIESSSYVALDFTKQKRSR